MKDALGHGSTTRGGAHASKVAAIPNGTIPISTLKLSVDGLATANGAFYWGMKPDQVSKDPIVVTKKPTGENYLLNGFHRVVAARMTGVKDLPVRYVPWSPRQAERYNREEEFE